MKQFKVDIHHHCYYSRPTANDTKIMNLFCINESYDSPKAVYKTAKFRGMDAVTMTDHNTIRGGIKLKEYSPEDTFISEEICAYFPEDKFRMHVLALDIDEKIHEEITRLRHNVYDLVQYFQQTGVLYILAHPAWGPSVPPQREHYEKFMVLFDKWEFFNGSRTHKNNAFIQALAQSYTLEKAQRLAEKHSLRLPTHTRIIGTGGSDAHTKRNVATAYTMAEGANNYKEFLDKIRSGEVTFTGEVQTLLPFAHTVYDLCGKHYSFGQRFIIRQLKDKYTKALARITVNPYRRFCLRAFRERYTADDMARDLDRLVVKTVKRILKKLQSRRGLDLLRDLAFKVMEAAIVLGPFLISTAYKFRFNRRLPKGDDFFPSINSGPRRVALIGDNMHIHHGVSMRVNQLIKHSQGKNHVLLPITCAESPTEGLHTIKSLHKFPLPVYEGQFLHVPAISELAAYLERQDVELVHILTPGTLGLVALGAAKLTGLPVIGSYHTDFADYIRHYHDNPIYSNVFERAQTWFYNQFDLVLALSNHSREYLIKAGVQADKIQIMRTGVDHQMFNPNIEINDVRHRLNPENKFMILFAGRLEREKNIDVLMAAFEKIHQVNRNTILVLAGTGNLRTEIETKHCPKYPAGSIKFLNWVSHKEMAKVYAAADLMLFPSTTETFGNVILEAQSCALPTLVANQGAAAEIIRHEETGFICQANDEDSYAEAALKLIKDEPLRHRMSLAAAKRSRNYSWGNAVDKLFEDYNRVVGM